LQVTDFGTPDEALLMSTRVAACDCGRLRVQCDGEPEIVSICHCTHCQRRTGSAFASNAYFLKEKVGIEGISKPFTRGSDSGGKITFFFCPECGGTVYWELEVLPAVYGVGVGSFADSKFPAPVMAIWAENKHHWVNMPDGLVERQKQSA
jgi:hypothetical protein